MEWRILLGVKYRGQNQDAKANRIHSAEMTRVRIQGILPLGVFLLPGGGSADGHGALGLGCQDMDMVELMRLNRWNIKQEPHFSAEADG